MYDMMLEIQISKSEPVAGITKDMRTCVNVNSNCCAMNMLYTYEE